MPLFNWIVSSVIPALYVKLADFVQDIFAIHVQKIFLQGDFQQTQNELDLTIEGQGFFQILMPNGDTAYSRTGSFKLDMNGRVVTSDGYLLQPEITVPSDFVRIAVGNDGIVSVQNAGETELTEIGEIELSKFINPGGLVSVGKNLFLPSESSGDAINGTPGEEGFGTVVQGFLEMSNVNVVEEMVNMIISQRAYEINSKAIQTSDEMLQHINNLKR